MKWKDNETQYIKDNIDSMPIKEIAKNLNRPLISVYYKAYSEGIRNKRDSLAGMGKVIKIVEKLPEYHIKSGIYDIRTKFIDGYCLLKYIDLINIFGIDINIE